MHGHPDVGLREQHLCDRTRRHLVYLANVLSTQPTNEALEEGRCSNHVLDWKLVCATLYFPPVPVLTSFSGCVTTIIRLRTLLLFKISYDPSWDYVPIVIWTELEVSAAFACISLPAIRVLLVKLTPKQLKGWLSEVTHGSSHQTLRRAADSHPPKREWHMNDTWINLASTEHNERG